jgi:2-oxoglutarate dehydrogenase E2 component (dihydrolipoamide succinyltransferase)
MGDTLVRMPKLADTLVEGTLGHWLKQVGEEVGQGDPLASIETDKVTTEMTSPVAGTLLEVLVPEGQTVPVETVIARIGAPAERVMSDAPPTPASHAAEPRTADGAAESTAAGVEKPAAVPKPTPVAARLLAEHGLSAAQIPSQSGRLTKDDVLRYLQLRPSEAPEPLRFGSGLRRGETPEAPGIGSGVHRGEMPERPGVGPGLRRADSLEQGTVSPGELIPLSSMRRAIAEHMTRASQTIPHGQTVRAADLTQLVAWREQHKAAFQRDEGANLTFTVLFVHALAHALAASSEAPINLGVAVAVDAGLIVPILRNAHSLSLGATARGIADLAARARTNKLSPDDVQSSSARMTVTNVGSFGNLTASPIVPLGQIGILGPGLVERRPLPGPDSGVRLGWRCLLALMFDRRAVTDFAADRLLRRVVTELTSVPQATLR